MRFREAYVAIFLSLSSPGFHLNDLALGFLKPAKNRQSAELLWVSNYPGAASEDQSAGCGPSFGLPTIRSE
jgi:hypothetical protein